MAANFDEVQSLQKEQNDFTLKNENGLCKQVKLAGRSPNHHIRERTSAFWGWRQGKTVMEKEFNWVEIVVKN